MFLCMWWNPTSVDACCRQKHSIRDSRFLWADLVLSGLGRRVEHNLTHRFTFPMKHNGLRKKFPHDSARERLSQTDSASQFLHYGQRETGNDVLLSTTHFTSLTVLRACILKLQSLTPSGIKITTNTSICPYLVRLGKWVMSHRTKDIFIILPWLRHAPFTRIDPW